MFVIDIPGIGEVEVDSKDALKKLQNQLSAYYKHLAEIAERKEQVPAQTLEAIQKLGDSIEAFAKAVVAEIREIKPQVTVEAPQVTVQAPEVSAQVYLPNPVIRLVLTKAERDWKGQLTAGTEIEVVR